MDSFQKNTGFLGCETASDVAESGSDSGASVSGTSILERAASSLFPKTTGTLEKTDDVVSTIQELLPQLRSILDGVEVNSVEFSNTTAAIIQLTELIRGLVQNVKELVSYTTQIIDAVVLLYEALLALFQKNLALIPVVIYRFLSLTSLAPQLVHSVLEKITKMLSPAESKHGDPETQRVEAQGMVDTFTSIVSIMTGTMILRRVPDDKEMRHVNETLRLRHGVKEQVTDMINLFIDLLRRIPDYMQLWAQHLMPMRFWVELFKPGTKYFEWIDEVESLCSLENKQKAAYDLDVQRRVRQAIVTAKNILSDVAKFPKGTDKLTPLLQTHYKSLQDLQDIIDFSGQSRGHRFEPFVVYLSGPPGIGKSYLSTVIPFVLAGAETDQQNVVYNRNPGIQYWDGYTGQFAVVYDDFAALTAGLTQGPGEFAELISIVSNDPLRLNMAAIPDKGECFRSRVVVISSNQAYPETATITNHDALYRRRHVLVQVAVRPENQNANGTLNIRDLDRTADNSQWVFQEMHATRRAARGEPMNYREFMRMLQSRWTEHQRLQDIALINSRNDVLDAVRMAQRVEAQVEEPSLMASFMRVTSRAVTQHCANKIISKSAEGLYSRLCEFAEGENAHPIYGRIVQVVDALIPIVTAGMVCFSAYRFAKWFTNESKTDKVLHVIQQHAKMKKKETTMSADEYERTRRVIHDVVSETFGTVIPPEEIASILDHTMRRIRKQAAYAGPKTSRTPKIRVTRQLGVDENAQQMIKNKIANNLVYVTTSNGTLQGLFVKGRLLLVPRHLFLTASGFLPDASLIQVGSYMSAEQYQFFLREEDMLNVGEDLCLYNCPVQVRQYKDISHLFMREGDLSYKRQFNASVVGTTLDGSILVNNVVTTRNARPLSYCPDLKDCDQVQVMAMRYWQYDANLGKGACGSVLVACDTQMMRKICGMHVAGANTNGYAQPVVQEDIAEAIAKFGIYGNGAPVPRTVMETLDNCRIEPQGNFSYWGTLLKPLHVSTKTKIYPSPICGKVYRTTTEPAVLSPADPRLEVPVKPLVMGIEKYGKVAVPLHQSILDQVLAHVSLLVQPFEAECGRRLLTQEESINGIPTIEFAEPIEMDTSPGYPWNQETKGLGGKHAYFRRESGKYVVDDERLEKAIVLRREMAKRGERVPSIWIDTLKDERRKMEKIRKGKTRVFTIPPVDYTIIFREYVQAFNVMCYNHRLKFFSAVGINPESMDWHQLYLRLSEVGSVAFAGDYSSWDGTLSPQVIMGVCEVINNWYADTDENQLVRKVLFEEIVHTNQVGINLVYATHIGNPSGTPMTSLLNTFVNGIYLRYVYMQLAPPEMRSLVFFEENVRDQEFGDDNIVAVAEKVATFFEPDAISRVFSEIGMVYTSALKDGNAKFAPVETLTFLKRGFRKDQFGFYLPTMDVETIYEMVNWLRRSALVIPDDLFVDNMNESLRFAFYHGREFFDNHRNKLLQAIDRNLRIRLLNYEYFYYWHYEFLNVAKPTKLVCGQISRERRSNPITSEQVSGIFQSQAPPASVQRGSGVNRMSRKIRALGGPTQEMIEFTRIEAESQQAVSVQNSQGIISLSQRTLEGDSGPNGSNVSQSRHAAACVNEPPWDLQKMVGRKAFVTDAKWSTSDALASMLQTFEVPKDLIVSYLQSAPFERFLFWNGTVRVTVQVNGTRFHQGRLVLAAAPYMRKDETQSNYGYADRFNAVTCLQHQFIDASSNNEASVDVPFMNPQSFLTLNDTYSSSIDHIGSVFLQVYSPLLTGTGSNQFVNYSVWVEMLQDNSFQVPLHATRTQVLRGNKNLGGFVRIQAQMGNMITTTTNNWGTISDSNLPTTITAEGPETELTALPMDNPAWTNNAVAIYRSPMQSFCNTTGIEHLERLDLCGGTQSLCDAETFATSYDETCMQHLLQKPTYRITIPWNSTDGTGTSLFTSFLGPMGFAYAPNGGVPLRAVDSQFIGANPSDFPTLWDFVSMRFKFWRGGIKIRLDIVASQMHTGRLFVSANYGSLPSMETGMPDAASQFGTIIDLSNEQRSFTLTFPYRAKTSWLQVAKGEPSGSESLMGSLMRYFMGSFSIRVLNGLVQPQASAGKVDVILHMSGDTDYEVYYPCESNASVTPRLFLTPIRTQRVQAQMASEEAADAVAVPSVTQEEESTGVAVAPTQSKSRPATFHFGQKSGIRHVNDVLKRYVSDPIQERSLKVRIYAYDDNASLINAQGNTFFMRALYGGETTAEIYAISCVPVIPVMRNPDSNAIMGRGVDPLSWIGSMFRFWKGSIRYKITLDPIWYNGGQGGLQFPKVLMNMLYLSPHSPEMHTIASVASTILPTLAQSPTDQFGYAPTGNAIMYANDQTPYLECEVPFLSQYHCLPTDLSTNEDAAAIESIRPATLFVVRKFVDIAGNWPPGSPYSGSTGIHIYKAAGDDFRYGGFIGIPRLFFAPALSKEASGAAYGMTPPPDRWPILKPTDRNAVIRANNARRLPETHPSAGRIVDDRTPEQQRRRVPPRPKREIAPVHTEESEVEVLDEEEYDRVEAQSLQAFRVPEERLAYGVRHFHLPVVIFNRALTHSVKLCTLQAVAQSWLAAIMGMANNGTPLYRAYFQLKSKLGFYAYFGGVHELQSRTTIHWREYYWTMRLRTPNSEVYTMRQHAPSTSVIMHEDSIELEDATYEAILVQIAMSLRAFILQGVNRGPNCDPPPYDMGGMPTLEDEVRRVKAQMDDDPPEPTNQEDHRHGVLLKDEWFETFEEGMKVKWRRKTYRHAIILIREMENGKKMKEIIQRVEPQAAAVTEVEELIPTTHTTGKKEGTNWNISGAMRDIQRRIDTGTINVRCALKELVDRVDIGVKYADSEHGPSHARKFVCTVTISAPYADLYDRLHGRHVGGRKKDVMEVACENLWHKMQEVVVVPCNAAYVTEETLEIARAMGLISLEAAPHPERHRSEEELLWYTTRVAMQSMEGATFLREMVGVEYDFEERGVRIVCSSEPPTFMVQTILTVKTPAFIWTQHYYTVGAMTDDEKRFALINLITERLMRRLVTVVAIDEATPGESARQE